MMMSQLLRAVALIAALLPPAQARLSLPLTGTVTDAAGKPIEGVRVVSGPKEDTRTNASGRYTLANPQDLVRFSLGGYRPVTKTWNNLAATVILEPATERPRVLMGCSDAVKNDKRQAGMSLRMSLPRDIKIKSGADAETGVLAVGYHVDWMLHGRGTQWSTGMPVLQLWKQLVTVEEHDISIDDPLVAISEYSGMRQDGSHYRFIGLSGESISYEEATVDTAAYFDRLLDSLCWNGR